MPCKSGKYSFEDLKSVRCFGFPVIWVVLILLVSVIVAILMAYAFGAFYGLSEKVSEDDGKNVTFRIVGRQEWKAKPSLHRPEPLLHPIQFIILLHTGNRNCFNLKDCGVLLREIQQYHVQKVGLWDIAPNFLIGGDGRAYEGRGWDFSGVYVTRFNLKSYGVSFIGNFDKEMPSPVQMSAYSKLIEEGIRLEKITPFNNIMAQRQFVNTTSPGDALYENITTWHNFTRNP